MRRCVVQGVISSLEEPLRVPAARLETSPQSEIDQSQRPAQRPRATANTTASRPYQLTTTRRRLDHLRRLPPELLGACCARRRKRRPPAPSRLAIALTASPRLPQRPWSPPRRTKTRRRRATRCLNLRRRPSSERCVVHELLRVRDPLWPRTSDARSLACRTASRVQSQASDRTSSVATEQSSSTRQSRYVTTRFGGSRHARGEGAVEKQIIEIGHGPRHGRRRGP